MLCWLCGECNLYSDKYQGVSFPQNSFINTTIDLRIKLGINSPSCVSIRYGYRIGMPCQGRLWFHAFVTSFHFLGGKFL